MSWWNPFSEETDLEVGNRILQAYFDEASKFSSFNYPTYEAWNTWIESRDAGYTEFLGNLVKSNYASISVDQAIQQAIDLANASSGQATLPKIIQGVSYSGGINWSAAIPEIGLETAKDVAVQATELAQDIGTGTLSTLKLVKYLPFILIGAGALYLVVVAKGHGKALGQLK